MSADFSKVRFNPYLNYAGVELQQGRVLLDADANELVAVLDRRLRALAGDVLGRTTVGANTPDAFKLSLVAGALQIGRGRLYVDGLLAENHGSGAASFDALMGGPSFTEATPIEDQPWLANPTLPTAGRHLVYLDVWNREVTHLEQPDLVEPAVGVDAQSMPAAAALSSTRTCQTVCSRVVASTPTAGSTKSGCSRCVTSRFQTSR